MSTKEVFTHLLQMVAGVGVYLISCGIISRNLEAASSDKLKKMFSKVSKNKLIGVAICGRPVSRHLDDGFTLEINRLCVTENGNCASMLYGRCAAIAKNMGYKKIITPDLVIRHIIIGKGLFCVTFVF